MKPFTSYQFRVKATNDIGDSAYSQESEAVTTLQDGENAPPPAPGWCDHQRPSIFNFFFNFPAPDKAPTIVSVTPHTTTSVLVRWQVTRVLLINQSVVGVKR